MAPTTRAEAIKLVLKRVDATLDQPGSGFPHYSETETGRWVRTPNGDWTGGFWVGLLWLSAWHTNEPRYLEAARKWSEMLRPRVDSQSVFKGFLFYYGAALGGLLLNEPTAKSLAASGTEGLAKMYNPAARLIPLGSEAEEAASVGPQEANIDALPGTTRLLLSRGENSAIWEIGRQHVRQHVALCVRADGSICQSATFSPDTGELIRRYTHKGVHDDSTWARAQAWGMLGLAQALQGGASEFRGAALLVADWWLKKTERDRVAYWDFDDPSIPRAPKDTSATAIAAAALLKLSKSLPERAETYAAVAAATVDELIGKHLTPLHPSDPRPPGILLHGCFNKRLNVGVDSELIWGDYFLFESLLALEGAICPSRI
jgi:unsaturated chondroitin disaccharide hydrolase